MSPSVDPSQTTEQIQIALESSATNPEVDLGGYHISTEPDAVAVNDPNQSKLSILEMEEIAKHSLAKHKKM